jgi:hypothetical protein
MDYTIELLKTPPHTRSKVELDRLADLATKQVLKKQVPSSTLIKKHRASKHRKSNAQSRLLCLSDFSFFPDNTK